MNSLAIEEIEKLVLKHRWILEVLSYFEKKYCMKSSEFYNKWSKGLLPEPSDPETHGDFQVWYGLIEELYRVDKKLSI